MAKKTTKLVLSNVTSNLAQNIQINNQDLVAIRVVQEEEKLENQRKELDANIRTIKKEVSDIQKNISKASKESVEKQFGKKFDALVSALKDLGTTPKREVETSLPTEGKKLNYNVTIGENNNHYNSTTFSFNGSIAINKSINKLIQEKIETEATLLDRQSEMIEIRRRISTLPALERRARANLSKIVLLQTEEGRALLEEVMNTESLD